MIPRELSLLIKTKEFQRLKNIKQLGSLYFVNRNAMGTRYEHSIGVSMLALKFGNILRNRYPHIVKNNHIKLLSIAGLLHDIGHGPYSHIFDTFSGIPHEERSIDIINHMVYKYNIDLVTQELDTIRDMINPPHKYKNTWLFQIISSEIDVDRVDYVIRDSNIFGFDIPFKKNMVDPLFDSFRIDKQGKLYLVDHMYSDKLLESRDMLFREQYKNKESLSKNIIILELLENSVHKDEITNIEKFTELDDSVIYRKQDDPRISDLLCKLEEEN